MPSTNCDCFRPELESDPDIDGLGVSLNILAEDNNYMYMTRFWTTKNFSPGGDWVYRNCLALCAYSYCSLCHRLRPARGSFVQPKSESRQYLEAQPNRRQNN